MRELLARDWKGAGDVERGMGIGGKGVSTEGDEGLFF